jgi:hypothetical protein
MSNPEKLTRTKRKDLYELSVRAASFIVESQEAARNYQHRDSLTMADGLVIEPEEAKARKKAIYDFFKEKVHPAAALVVLQLTQHEIVERITYDMTPIWFSMAEPLDRGIDYAGALSIVATGADRFTTGRFGDKEMWASRDDTPDDVLQRYMISTVPLLESEQYRRWQQLQATSPQAT